MLNVFITGQNSAKTLVTAGIAATMQSLGYSTGVYMPVHTGGYSTSGVLKAHELRYIKSTDPKLKTYFSYLLRSNDIPLIAAKKDNLTIKPNVIFEDYMSICRKFECFLVSGTHGIATPITDKFLEIDIVQQLNLPVLFVISPYKSTINDILIMINHAVAKNVKISGVIIADCPYKTTDSNILSLPKLIEKYTDTRVVGAFPQIQAPNTVSANDLISYTLSGINLESVFKTPIAKLKA